jgi:DNA-directed RNA polymerase subunit RPC12/RpoP
MPIRFRCAYCNQLMGIATRKAGTVVRCPKCGGEIIVPVPEGMESSDEPAPPEPEPVPAPSGPAVFEDRNFEKALGTAAASAGTSTLAADAPPLPAPVEVPMPPAAPPKRRGLFLPLGILIVCIGVIALLLILMFVLGVVIGHYSK